MRHRPTILLRAYAVQTHGYGVLAIQLARALVKRGVRVVLEHLGKSETIERIPEDVRALVRRKTDGLPTLIVAPPGEPTDSSTVFLTMWETTRLHRRWVERLNLCRAVIVPSEFCQIIFDANGITVPVHRIVPGVDRTVFAPDESVRPARGVTVFGTAGRTEEGGVRKNIDAVIGAFLIAFHGNDHVRLEIKLSPQCEPVTVDDKRVALIRDDLPERKLAAWYRSLSCYVSASRGEGIGLCVAKGVPITTESGVKRIEQIEVGDMVLGSSGEWRQVRAKSSRSGKRLIAIRCHSLPEVFFTPEHPVLCVDRLPGERIADFRKRHTEPRWKRASEVDENDYLVVRPPRVCESACRTLLVPYANGNEIVEGDKFTLRHSNRPTAALSGARCAGIIGVSYSKFQKCIQPRGRQRGTVEGETVRATATRLGYFSDKYQWLPTTIHWTPQWCRLVGYYVTEGSPLQSGVEFALHSTKDEVAVLQIREALELLGLRCTRRHRGGQRMSLHCCSTIIGRALVDLCGRGARRKKLPGLIWNLSAECRCALLEAIYRGDGHNSSSGTLSLTTVSQVLAFQVRDLWMSLGIPASIDQRQSYSRKFGRTHRKSGTLVRSRFLSEWSVDVGGSWYEKSCALIGLPDVRPDKGERTGSWFVKHGDCWLVRVRNVRALARPGKPVYDISVDKDESFVAGGVVVHNCPLEALSCGTPIIACRYSGHAEYMDESVGYPVEYVMERAGGMYAGLGLWAEPNTWRLVDAMRLVHERPGEARIKGQNAAHRADRFSWGSFCDGVIKVLDGYGMLKPAEPSAVTKKQDVQAEPTPDRTICGVGPAARRAIGKLPRRVKLIKNNLIAVVGPKPEGCGVGQYSVDLANVMAVPFYRYEEFKSVRERHVIFTHHRYYFEQKGTLESLQALRKLGHSITLDIHDPGGVEQLNGFYDQAITHSENFSEYMKAYATKWVNLPLMCARPRVESVVLELKLPECKHIIGWHGLWAAHKGVDLVIAAVRTLVDRKCDAGIMAFGSYSGTDRQAKDASEQYYQQCVAVAQALDLGGRATLHAGIMSPAEIKAAMGVCDIFCLPYVTLVPGQSSAVLAFLHAGRPIIVSNVPMFADVIGRCAKPLDECTPGCIADTVQHLLEGDPAMCRSWGRKAKAEYERRAPKKIVAQYRKIVLGSD